MMLTPETLRERFIRKDVFGHETIGLNKGTVAEYVRSQNAVADLKAHADAWKAEREAWKAEMDALTKTIELVRDECHQFLQGEMGRPYWDLARLLLELTKDACRKLEEKP
jgi:hypothetical protein